MLSRVFERRERGVGVSDARSGIQSWTGKRMQWRIEEAEAGVLDEHASGGFGERGYDDLSREHL